jgi:hypothetical protein
MKQNRERNHQKSRPAEHAPIAIQDPLSTVCRLLRHYVSQSLAVRSLSLYHNETAIARCPEISNGVGTVGHLLHPLPPFLALSRPRGMDPLPVARLRAVPWPVMRVGHVIDTHPSFQATAESGIMSAAKLGPATEIKKCGHSVATHGAPPVVPIGLSP